MNPTPLRTLFDSAVALPPAQRAAWLREHCHDAALQARLTRMLAQTDADEGDVTSPLPSLPADRLAAQIGQAMPPAGTCIGPFELRELIGEGGYASVYRAVREVDGVQHEVALKLLHGTLFSPQAQRQFRREHEALTRLRHPDIATLIDAGVTPEGQAWLALQLVQGVPITQYARARRLDLAARLRLFVRVCHAVEAAHRALVVHRDLKPANVLVGDDGRVQLIDFGVARRIDADEATHTHAPGFTPAYAAPELHRGEVATPATDVYALGVLLGELLTGERINDGSGRTPSSRIAPTSSPSSDEAMPAPMLRRRLRGDLDNILVKAIEPEPARRYAYAGALADDVEAHLDGRPVAAHPPSRWYRTRKFVARHRGGVATTLAFSLAVLAALGVALWQAREARHQAERAGAVRDFLVQLFDAASARLPRDQRPTTLDLVEQARRRLDSAQPLEPRTRADVLLGLGQIELSMSDFAAAERSFAAAIALLEADGDATAVSAARVLQAEAWQRAGRNQDAIDSLEPQLGALRAAPDAMLERALAVLAAARMATGAPAEALEARREAVTRSMQRLGAAAADAIAARFALGGALGEAGQWQQAIATLEPALRQWRDGGGVEDQRYIAALGALAAATDNSGDLPLTVARLEQLLALKQRIYEAPHAELAQTLRNLAIVKARSGPVDAALPLFERALEMQLALFGPMHEEVALTRSGRGIAYVRHRRFDEAMADYRAALAICEQAQLRSEMCSRSRNNLGQALYRRGDMDAAREQMQIALQERRAIYGDRHPSVALSLGTLANVAAAQRDGAAAVALADEGMAILREHALAGSREGAMMLNTRAQALHVAGRDEEALAEIERCLALWQRLAPEQVARTVTIMALRAQIQHDLGRIADATATADAAVALAVPAQDLGEGTHAILRRLAAPVGEIGGD